MLKSELGLGYHQIHNIQKPLYQKRNSESLVSEVKTLGTVASLKWLNFLLIRFILPNKMQKGDADAK